MKKIWMLLIVTMVLIGIIILSDIIFNKCNNIRLIGYGNFFIWGITAALVFLYMRETYKLRDIEQKRLTKENSPTINLQLVLHPEIKDELLFILINTSQERLSCLVNIKYKIEFGDGNALIDNKDMDFEPYNGKQIWNLQYREKKQGHFRWSQLIENFDETIKLQIKDLERKHKISEKDIKEKNLVYRKFYDDLIRFEIHYLKSYFKAKNINCIPNNIIAYEFMKKFKIKFLIDLLSFNEDKVMIYYTTVTYNWKPFIGKLVPVLTSKKAYWDYERYPDWILKNEYYKKYLL